MTCPKCESIDWDWANIGLSEAKTCLNCGHIYLTPTKKRYKVTAVKTVILEEIIEADSETQAWAIAKELSLESMEQVPFSEDWHVYDINEVTENK